MKRPNLVARLKNLTASQLQLVAKLWEQEFGCDSIDTIKRIYDHSHTGSVSCCWPGCAYRVKSESTMWFHIHFTCTHGQRRLDERKYNNNIEEEYNWLADLLLFVR